MRVHGMTTDDQDASINSGKGPKTSNLPLLKRRDSNGMFHALGHFPGTTLTERVVQFLESYSDSAYGLG